MIDYNYTGADEDEQARVAWFMQLFQQHRMRRINFEVQWEEAAAMAWPEWRSSFEFGRDNAPGVKRSQYQLDSAASIASHRFAAIVEWLLTPSNMMWSKIRLTNQALMRDRSVKMWCAAVSQILWSERYRWTANFQGQNHTNMQSLGVFGNMGMFIDELDDYLDPREQGLRYMSMPVGEGYVVQDHQGRVVGFIRHFRRNAQQTKTKWPDKSVPVIEAALSKGSQNLFNFLHFVLPRTDYTPFERASKRGKKFESAYVSIEGHCLMEEGGYRTFPVAYGRYMQAPDEDYGRGPGQMALASLKTKNAEKRIFLKQGHRAADPAYLVGDTGLIDLKTHSGAFNAGGMTADGKPLVSILPTGNIQITKELMAEEDAIINDAFLVSLFKLILENPDGMPSARQVVEYINERGILLHPTVGRQNAEYLGPLTDRELDLLSWQRKLPPMPPIMREARADYQMEYVNPISLAVRGQEIAGFMRISEFAQGAVAAGASPEILDNLEYDQFIADAPDYNNFPQRWTAGPQKLAQKRQGRAQQQQQENYIKSLPGLAAKAKADAISAKAQAGQNIGGTLSGVPAGQMPIMPGQQ